MSPEQAASFNEVAPYNDVPYHGTGEPGYAPLGFFLSLLKAVLNLELVQRLKDVLELRWLLLRRHFIFYFKYRIIYYNCS